MWSLGLSCNNLKNINNAVSLTAEHAICSFHLPGYVRKGKMHPFTTLKIVLPTTTVWKVCFRSPTFNFRNEQANIFVMFMKIKESAHVRNWRSKGHLAPLMRPTKFPGIRWPKNWSFSFSINPSNEYSGLIFRMDMLDLLAVQGILESLLQL